MTPTPTPDPPAEAPTACTCGKVADFRCGWCGQPLCRACAVEHMTVVGAEAFPGISVHEGEGWGIPRKVEP